MKLDTKLELPFKLSFKPKNKEQLRVLIASVVLAVFLLIGVFAYLGRYAYAENGHNWYLFFYVLACMALFLGIRRFNIPLIVMSLLLAFGIQGFANQKFNWRQSYVSDAIAGQHFALQEFIETYPSYEQYVFRFLGEPDWVRLNRDCIQPALNDAPVGPHCTSTDSIFNYYNIDLIREMSGYAHRMRTTAKLLEDGKLTRRHEYINCIESKRCATIPLLPRGVDAEQIDPMSQDYLDIRQAFWSLINDKRLSPEACTLTPMCQAMVKLNLVQINGLPF